MGHQRSKPEKKGFASNKAKVSQEDFAKMLSTAPFQPEDYVIKDVEDQINQTHEVSQEMTEEQIEFMKKCVGRIIAKYPKKLRKTSKGLQSNQEFITNGTASFIDDNLLITAAHNIFLRQYNEMASEVYFLPEKLNNIQSAAVDLIPAQKYAVFEEYSNPQNEYTQKFDVALVVLQDHKFSNQTACLDIEWSYKRWEHLSPSLHLFGYPENLKNKTTKINEMKYENKYIMHQDEMVCYRNTCGGESGGPLVKLSNSEKGSKIKLVGVHKGVRGNNSVGLTLNSAQNTQEIIYQLAEKLQVEDRMKGYEFSCKKMREFMKKEKNVTEKLKLLDKVQEENLRQKEEIKRLNTNIDQLKGQIITLNGSIQKMKAQQLKMSTQTTKNEGTKVQTLQKSIEEKLYEKLYQNIERYISKDPLYYGYNSYKYHEKVVSKKEVEKETIMYLNHLKQRIKPLPPQHQQQLLFLIDIHNSQDKCIMNELFTVFEYLYKTGPAKFNLKFYEKKQRIDVKQFLTFNNWNHIQELCLSNCGWFNDDDWRTLIKNADSFSNLKQLNLYNNKISEVKEGDIDRFKLMEFITFVQNPLSARSKQVLLKIRQKNNKIQVRFDK